MTSANLDDIRDDDIRNSEPALKRAAIRARKLAEQTGTPCWVMRDGKLVDAVTGEIHTQDAQVTNLPTK